MSEQQMIAIVGWIDVDPADRDRAIADTADIQRSTRDDEPGCLAYALCADPVNPARIQISELWLDAASLEAHFVHPNFRATGEVMRTVTRTGASMMKYRIDAVDQVRGPDGAASARFGSAGD